MLHLNQVMDGLDQLFSENQFNTSIWGDEGFSAILSMKPLPEIIQIIINDTSPPLWNIWEWAAFQYFGTSETVIRSLSLLFYLGTLLFTYKVGSYLWGRKTGTISALLTGLNPFFFIYAFEGRMYSILAFGVTASMYFFIKLTREKEPSVLTHLGYVTATCWALYSHHFAIFALFIQGIWFVYTFISGHRIKAKRIFKLFIAIGLLYIPWLYPLYLQTSKVGGGFWLATPDIYDLRTLFYDYLAEGIKTKELQVPYADKAIYEISLWVVFGIAILRKWHHKIKSSLFLLTWFVGPIVLTWIVSQFFQSIFFNRYLLYTIPAGMILLGSGRRKYSTYLIVILLVLYSIMDFHYFTHPTKLPFRQMADYVKSTRNEDDFLVNWNSGSHHIWETKYYGIPAPIYSPDGGELPYFVGTALMEEGDVIRSLPNINRIGVITSGSIDDIVMPNEYSVEERKEIDGLKFVWYKRSENE